MKKGQSHLRKYLRKDNETTPNPLSAFEIQVNKETYQKQRKPIVESNDHASHLPKCDRLSETNSVLTKHSVVISSKKNIRKRRFFDRQDSEESELKTFNQPSCGSIHILKWLRKHEIDFNDLMKQCKIKTTKDVLHRAIAGFRNEKEFKRKSVEVEEICNRLTLLYEGNRTRISCIGKYCVYIYTKYQFLHERVNKVLREKNDKKSRNLAPYCALLSAYIQKRCFHNAKRVKRQTSHVYIANGLKYVYRGTKLTANMVKQYKRKVGQRISWSGFTSISKDPEVAKVFEGNTIFIIDVSVISSISTDYLADIHKLSQYPDEQEVLLTAGINLVIGKIKSKRDGTHEIKLYLSKNHDKNDRAEASEETEDKFIMNTVYYMDNEDIVCQQAENKFIKKMLKSTKDVKSKIPNFIRKTPFKKVLTMSNRSATT